jgi:ferredoxin
MKVTFQIEGATPVIIECNAGDNLLELARRGNVAIDAPCSGNGSCGKCRVQLLEGELETIPSRHISQEEYDRKYKDLIEEMNALRTDDMKPEITERDLEPLRAFLSLDLDTVYKTLSREEKRALWRSVVSEIVLYPDGRIEPKFF